MWKILLLQIFVEVLHTKQRDLGHLQKNPAAGCYICACAVFTLATGHSDLDRPEKVCSAGTASEDYLCRYFIIRIMSKYGRLICTVCRSYYTDTLSDLLQHIRLFHAHQPNLSIECGIGGCQRVYNNFGTFQNHISGFHRSESNPTNVFGHLTECSDDPMSMSSNTSVLDDRSEGTSK